MSSLTYLEGLIKDCKDEKTVLVKLPLDEIEFYYTTNNRGKKIVSGVQYNIVDENNKEYTYTSQEGTVLLSILQYLFSDETSDGILIEYYINTGVIKSVDLTDKSDMNALQSKRTTLYDKARKKALQDMKNKDKSKQNDSVDFDLLDQIVTTTNKKNK